MSVLQVTLTGDLVGYPVTNIFGVATTDPVIPADLVAVANAFDSFYPDTIMTVLHQNYTLSKISVVDLSGGSIGVDLDVDHGGEISGALLPSFVCARVNLTTALRGRSYRGRTGLAGIPEDYTDSLTPNTLKATPRSELAGAVQDFVDGVNGAINATAGGSAMAVISQVHNGVKRHPPIATLITGTNVSASLGTRRGRM